MAHAVSFYSFKGGVGRSLILASVAILLTKQGHRVACIDFDLHSGGLHMMFGLESPEIGATVLDLLTTLPSDVAEVAIDLTDRVASRVHAGGKLWLLPTVTETEKLRETMESGRDLAEMLSNIIAQVSELLNPAFILVDSTSGFSEMASGPILKADCLVCVLRPNRQNTEGIRNLLDIIDTLSDRPAILLVLSQVSEAVKAESVHRLEDDLGSGRSFDVVLPYLSELSGHEGFITHSHGQIFNGHLGPVVEWLEGRPREK